MKLNLHIYLVLGLIVTAIKAKERNFGGDDCCEWDEYKCKFGEGDCDSDWDCQGAMYCGDDNCVIQSWEEIVDQDVFDDCCYGPMTCSKGFDDCCGNAGYLCGDNEGDCDWDSDCKSGYYCGSNNCAGIKFDSSDDCCDLISNKG